MKYIYVYHLEKSTGIVSITLYTVAIAKIADSQQIIAFYKLFFAIFYLLDPLVLQWNFVADNIKLIFSKSNVNNIVDTKMQPNNSLHSSNQTN